VQALAARPGTHARRLLIHPVVQGLVFLAVVVLSVFKSWGRAAVVPSSPARAEAPL
jgi:hypothetical protein